VWRRRIEARSVSALTILGYHNIEATPFFRARRRKDGVRGFVEQMRFVRRFMNPIGLSDAARMLASGRALPPRSVAVTFDDGYRDMCFVAAPILEEFSIPASFFVVPAYLTGSEDPWWERLAWACEHATAQSITWRGEHYGCTSPRMALQLEAQLLGDLKMMNVEERRNALSLLVDELAPAPRRWRHRLMLDWSDLANLHRRGFDIGSHTSEHAILARETSEKQRVDLACSRRLIEEQLTAEVHNLAYPNGGARDFSDQTLAAAAAAGFQNAVTCVPGRNTAGTSRLALHRVLVTPQAGLPGLAKSLTMVHAAELARVLSGGESRHAQVGAAPAR
jgi:peptidoglycan/xylan/chitin deacetylase (PgdA/CDA1 family)